MLRGHSEGERLSRGLRGMPAAQAGGAQREGDARAGGTGAAPAGHAAWACPRSCRWPPRPLGPVRPHGFQCPDRFPGARFPPPRWRQAGLSRTLRSFSETEMARSSRGTAVGGQRRWPGPRELLGKREAAPTGSPSHASPHSQQKGHEAANETRPPAGRMGDGDRG